jgi:hypothetical protein
MKVAFGDFFKNIKKNSSTNRSTFTEGVKKTATFSGSRRDKLI